MDRKKIREFLKQTHPNRKIVEQDDDPGYTADSNATDVDVSGLSPKTWKKFGDTPAAKSRAAAPSSSNLRERFKPRKLTGAGARSDAPRTAGGRRELPSRTPGKLALERLTRTDGADADDPLEVLVDEEHGVIGESDSGPEEE